MDLLENARELAEIARSFNSGKRDERQLIDSMRRILSAAGRQYIELLKSNRRLEPHNPGPWLKFTRNDHRRPSIRFQRFESEGGYGLKFGRSAFRAGADDDPDWNSFDALFNAMRHMQNEFESGDYKSAYDDSQSDYIDRHVFLEAITTNLRSRYKSKISTTPRLPVWTATTTQGKAIVFVSDFSRPGARSDRVSMMKAIARSAAGVLKCLARDFDPASTLQGLAPRRSRTSLKDRVMKALGIQPRTYDSYCSELRKGGISNPTIRNLKRIQKSRSDRQRAQLFPHKKSRRRAARPKKSESSRR